MCKEPLQQVWCLRANRSTLKMYTEFNSVLMHTRCNKRNNETIFGLSLKIKQVEVTELCHADDMIVDNIDII